jgi:hypothetical protein
MLFAGHSFTTSPPFLPSLPSLPPSHKKRGMDMMR